MIVSNTLPKILATLDISLKKIGSDENIQTLVIDEHHLGYPVLRKIIQMNTIDLHEPHVIGAILVVRNLSSRTAFSANDCFYEIRMSSVMSSSTHNADFPHLLWAVRE